MSLRARLLAAFAYVLVLVIVALLVPLALNLSRRVDAEIRSEAQGQAQLLAAFVVRAARRRERSSSAGRASSARGPRRARDRRRRRAAGCSPTRRAPGCASTSYASRPEIAEALRGDPTQGERHSDSLGEDLLFTAVPVVSGGRTEGAVRVTQSVDAVNDEVRSDVIALIGVAAVVLLLGLGLAWLLAGSLARPLRAARRHGARAWPAAISTRARAWRAPPSSARWPRPSTT